MLRIGKTFALLAVVFVGQSCITIQTSGARMDTASLENTSNRKKHRGILAECQEHMNQAKSHLNDILQVKGERNEKNTLRVLNKMQIELDNAMATAGLYSQVHPDKTVRDESEICEQEVERLQTEISLNRDLYDAVSAVKTSGLDPLASRFLEKTIQDFKRSGVDKDEATREKIKKVEEELVIIGQEFGRNIREDVRHVDVDAKSGLKGLPLDYVKSKKVDENGKVRVTTDYPDYIPFMTYAEDATIRKELWTKFLSRAYPKNKAVLKSMIEKRHELAKLLNYDSYADFVVEDKMIETTKSASEFIEKIAAIAKPMAEQEYGVLLETKKSISPAAKEVQGFERAFLDEKIKREKFQVDSLAMRPYFEFERVQDGLLSVTSQLFGIRYVEVNDAQIWHESVKVYDVMDGSEKMGRIYLDLFPRENKYKHAAQFTLRSGVKGVQLPEGVLVCNFSDPNVNSPALMDFDQVVTFFHEFGHLLHHVMGGKQDWIRFSGVATEWDFVEAPSQLMEEWAWDTGVLQSFAKHHETGEVIPAQMIERMRAADEFGKGLDACQQMFYAAMSLEYYRREPATFDPHNLLVELQSKYSKFAHVEGTYFNLNFGHLEGYSAMYYTYMWSKVIAKDLLTPFKKDGMLNAKDAKRYRKYVLEAGGSKDAADLVQDFLGRKYEFKAFQEWLQSA